MVLGNVPKLHGVIGLLAVALAIPAGCSDRFQELRSVAHVSVQGRGIWRRQRR